MISINKGWLGVILASGAITGCAAVVPAELVQAREGYAQSRVSLAATEAPTELYNAKVVLDRANREFDEHGDTAKTRDLAYIASRRLDIADVRARTEQDRRAIVAAAKAGVLVRSEEAQDTRAALALTREQLKDARRDNQEETSELRASNAEQSLALDRSDAQLRSEREARSSVESRLSDAMKDLSAVAVVSGEPRGVVITLSGGILFVPGRYALLHTAEYELDQIARALNAEPSDEGILVEGHTDSRGSVERNQALSSSRANAVRDYLIGRGVPAERIRALGYGATHPVVDNDTAENRANNRRVEIVVGGAK